MNPYNEGRVAISFAGLPVPENAAVALVWSQAPELVQDDAGVTGHGDTVQRQLGIHTLFTPLGIVAKQEG